MHDAFRPDFVFAKVPARAERSTRAMRFARSRSARRSPNTSPWRRPVSAAKTMRRPSVQSSPVVRPPTTTETEAPVPRAVEDAPRRSRRRRDDPSAPRCERPALAAARLTPGEVPDGPPPRSDLPPLPLESREFATAQADAPSAVPGRRAHRSKVERAARTAQAIHRGSPQRKSVPPRRESRAAPAAQPRP
jgi:hypothetical protein